MNISTITLVIKGTVGGEGGPAASGSSPPKGKGVLEKWLTRIADALKRLCWKTIETLLAIVGSFVGAILRCFGKAVRFVAEYTWALIVFVARFIAVLLIQKGNTITQDNVLLWYEKIYGSSYFHDPERVMNIRCFTHHSRPTTVPDVLCLIRSTIGISLFGSNTCSLCSRQKL